MTKLNALAISWFFAPYVGSADLDFFKRIKDVDMHFDVVQAKRDIRDDRVLRFATKASFFRHEVSTDHLRPRTRHTRDEFRDAALYHFKQSRDRFDLLVSHSNEIHSHAVALEIKKQMPELPWVAYFGDLFVKNPYIRYIPGYPLVEEDMETERETLRRADRIILNNHFQKELMFDGPLEKYAEKAIVIPHCFDPLMYPEREADKIPNGRFTLAHLGTLYHTKRTAEPVLKAVDRLLEIYPHYKNTFEVVFYGGSPCSHDISVHAFMKHRNHVRFEDPVSYMDSLRIMSEADALLLLDGIFNIDEDGLDCNPFFAGKLADYMGAYRPIMAVTMTRGPSAEILSESRNLIADLTIDRIAYVIKRYIDRKIEPDYSVYDRYSSKRVGLEMESALRGLVNCGVC